MVELARKDAHASLRADARVRRAESEATESIDFYEALPKVTLPYRRYFLSTVLTVIALFILVAVEGLFTAVNRPDPYGAFAYSYVGLIVSASLYFTFLVIQGTNARRVHEWDHSRRLDRAQASSTRLESYIENAASDALSRALNAVLLPMGRLPFPSAAPRLVELDAERIAPTAAISAVRDFIREHTTSAIGIAGTRGAGKSTLMSAIADDNPRDLIVRLSAPVRYEATDFLRRVLHSSATAIINQAESDLSALGRPRWGIRGLREPSAVVALASLVAACLVVAMNDNSLPIVWRAWLVPSLLLALSYVSLVVFVLQAVGRRARAREWQRLSMSSIHAATAAREWADYDSENTNAQSAGLSVGNQIFTIERSSAHTRRDRNVTPAQVVERIRLVLTTHADEHPGARILVLIDELDKIGQVEDLIGVVNDIKDILHIPGVHVLVSVSEDALLSFQKRGLASRDAFDSAFDTVIRVGTMSTDESTHLLSSRAEGFPPVASLACHAWSGGVPRELIRIARELISLNRTSAGQSPFHHLVTALVRGDGVAKLEAVLETLDPADDDYDRLVTVRAALKQSIDEQRDEFIEIAPLTRGHQWNSSANNALAETCVLGELLCRAVRRQLEHSGRPGLIEQFAIEANAIGTALSQRSNAPYLWNEAYTRAIRVSESLAAQMLTPPTINSREDNV